MASGSPKFGIDEEIVYAGKRMRVAGLVQFGAASGQKTARYLLAEPASAPVIVEDGDGRFSLLRPFPAAVRPRTSGNVVTVGREKYTLVGVRKLQVLAAAGQSPGAIPRAAVILSGVFEGPMGTLLREFAPGTRTQQAYYLVKTLGKDDVLSTAEHAAAREDESRAAANRALGED